MFNNPFKVMIKVYLPHLKTNFVQTGSSILFCLLFICSFSLSSQVKFEKELKISDKGLFFDGSKVANTAGNGSKYDYVFGNRITPHGDCIKEYNGFVFATWYRGGESDRHVMLSRYNTKTGVTKTIEFPHRHTGFQNKPWLGESHNTIAVGICPIDGTIHMVYDLHAYSPTRPSNESLKNDYYRYSYSKKDAATVSDNDFKLSLFVQDNPGDYKFLKMRPDESYTGLTYPSFFLNKKGELFMWIREGGNNNGKYMFCKYNGSSWSKFTDFNVLNAKSNGWSQNWGLYGDIKFSGGKMRIGFHTRLQSSTDKYLYNNGFHYAYSDDPNGLKDWKNHNGSSFSLPLKNPTTIKISEPGDLVPSSGANSVTISSGCDWITTDNDDVHFVTSVRGSDGKWKNVHSYKKGSDNSFKTSTNFPGGNLYTYDNEVYLIGLSGGRVFVEKADGGTNNWNRIYTQSGGKSFRHGNVYISDDGKLYFYLMENKSGSAQPIYLQIIDLGLGVVNENNAPTVNITSPQDGAVFELGEEIALSATANDSDGSIVKVNFKVNDAFYKTDNTKPYENSFTPTESGSYKIAARAFDDDDTQTEVFVTINVLGPNNPPTGNFIAPAISEIDEGYQSLYINFEATDPDDDEITSAVLSIDSKVIRSESQAPFEWGHQSNTTDFSFETLGLKPGTHVLKVEVTDARGAKGYITKMIEVMPVVTGVGSEEISGLTVFPNPSESGLFHLNKKANWEVFNLQRQKLHTGTEIDVDLSTQPKGIYFIRVNNEVIQLVVK